MDIMVVERYKFNRVATTRVIPLASKENPPNLMSPFHSGSFFGGEGPALAKVNCCQSFGFPLLVSISDEFFGGVKIPMGPVG